MGERCSSEEGEVRFATCPASCAGYTGSDPDPEPRGSVVDLRNFLQETLDVAQHAVKCVPHGI